MQQRFVIVTDKGNHCDDAKFCESHRFISVFRYLETPLPKNGFYDLVCMYSVCGDSIMFTTERWMVVVGLFQNFKLVKHWLINTFHCLDFCHFQGFPLPLNNTFKPVFFWDKMSSFEKI